MQDFLNMRNKHDAIKKIKILIGEDIFLFTINGIGKLHLLAHRKGCCPYWSFYYLPGVGLTCGEAVERIWDLLNVLAMCTREMNPGHRHNVINDWHD